MDTPRSKESKLSIYKIAKQQGMPPRWVRELTKRYGNVPLYKIETGVPSRMPSPIPAEERKTIMGKYGGLPMCAVKIEQCLKSSGLPYIPHNWIHKILFELDLARKGSRRSANAANRCATNAGIQMRFGIRTGLFTRGNG